MLLTSYIDFVLASSGYGMGMQWQSVMAQRAQNKALGIINFKEERHPSVSLHLDKDWYLILLFNVCHHLK